MANKGKESTERDVFTEIDAHTKRASEMFGVPEREVTMEQRRLAKAWNFAEAYGVKDVVMPEHGVEIITVGGRGSCRKFYADYTIKGRGK